MEKNTQLADRISKQKKEIAAEKIRIDRASNRVAAGRIVTFLAGVVLLYMGISAGKTYFTVMGVLLLLGFILLVRIHAGQQEKMQKLDSEDQVLTRYQQRIRGTWQDFQDDGSAFLEKEDTVSRDLDLLGPSSLYQMLCTAHTTPGRRKLASVLSDHRPPEEQEIESRYDAVREMASHPDLMISFEGVSELISRKKEEDIQRITRDEDGEPPGEDGQKKEKNAEIRKFPVFLILFMILVPVLNICSIISYAVGNTGAAGILITFIAGLVLTWAPGALTEPFLEPVQIYGRSAGDLIRQLSMLENVDFKSDKLKKIKDRISGSNGLLKALRDLGRIGMLNTLGFNPILHMLLAGFLGWDLWVARAGYRWNRKNEGAFAECEEITARVETISSLAVLQLIRATVKPEILPDSDIRIEAQEMYHPLLDPGTVVANDAQLSSSVTIITGSNMSGKTTFMRTAALNMCLAYLGCGVCATFFAVPRMQIFTSMRVTDDVANGISTFYAEILRIKQMAEYIENTENTLPAACFIDEIFKGTNSADRIVGAEEALKKLSGGRGLVIVTTHDFELCDLKAADGAPAENFHFEESYENGQMKFDYRIREGRCTTRNARAILKMAGL